MDRMLWSRAGALSVAAWCCFFTGLAGVLWDNLFHSSPVVAWVSYTLAVLGAVLFCVASVMKAPAAPEFLESLPDPWGDHSGSLDDETRF